MTPAFPERGGAGVFRYTPPMSRPSAHAIVAAFALFVQLILASPAHAQHEAFVNALSEFTAALPGTYGDEGGAARSALDRMERGLTEWNQTLREYEGNIKTIAPTASPGRVIDMHRTMGMFY